jgi:UDP-glucose 4-epimerase
MATAWVTGAKGFIGRHLALHLSRRGYQVHGIGHGLWPAFESEAWGISLWVNGEINAASLESLKRNGGTPQYVFHVAGGSSVGSSFANPQEDFSRTVSTTERLLDWLRLSAAEARVVTVSSAAVYGALYRDPIVENSLPRPVSPYGYHKLMMEELCQSYSESFGLGCTVIRLFSVYGPWLRKQLLWDLCSNLAGGAKVLALAGSGNELRDWIEIQDVVSLIDHASALEGSEFLAINGGSGIATAVAEVATAVVAAWGSDAQITFPGGEREGDPFSLVAAPGVMADRGFAWRIPLNEGIPRYVQWFREAHT